MGQSQMDSANVSTIDDSFDSNHFDNAMVMLKSHVALLLLSQSIQLDDEDRQLFDKTWIGSMRLTLRRTW